MSEAKTLTYHSKLVGVTFEGRQDIISTLRGKEPLRVRREADNKYDPKAVAVDVYVKRSVTGHGDNTDVSEEAEWVPIGYIAKDKNSDISAAIDAGESVYIQMGGITGGGEKAYGVNISLEYKTAPVKEETVKADDGPTKKETLRVLTHIVKALGGEIDEPVKATETYVSPITGESIDLKVVNGHRRLEGFTSGSMFPDQFYPPFDKEAILKALVEKYNVPADAVEAMWKLNNEASTGYGTAVHAALENYDKNFLLGDAIKTVKVLKTKTNIGPNKALSKNPFIKHLVEAFHKQFGGDYERLSEVFVWDEGMKLCGSIDRIKIVDRKKKIIRIQDFKTDGNIHEKKYQVADSPFKKSMGNELLDLHWLQLSFYAFVLSLKGWTTEGLDIFWLNPEKLVKGDNNPWELFSSDVIDISEVITGVENV